MSDSKKRSFHKGKNNYYSQNQNKKRILSLEPGVVGFFCTCNFQEKNCVREAYNILNEYADKLYGPQEPRENTTADTKNETSEADADTVEVEDISDVLEKQINNMKSGGHKFNRFQSLMTSVPNCIFIRSKLDESPVKLGQAIVEDIAKTKLQRTRYLLRLVPIEATCSVKIADIIDAAGKLFDKHFLGEPTTFSIVFNRRYNNALSRDVVIQELAALITSKNSSHKADLTNPKLAVIVEIIKGICLMSVLPNYFVLKKYNVVELCATKEKPSVAGDAPDEDKVNDSPKDNKESTIEKNVDQQE